jgi:molybdopterin synthase sulfur carrier subunit
MHITVKFFASLRERVGRAEVRLDAPAPLSAAEVWRRAADGAPMPANTLVAVNMEYADREREVRPGDEVAFFPPVTGGAG